MKRIFLRALVVVVAFFVIDVLSLLTLHIGIVFYRAPAEPTALMQAARRNDTAAIGRLIAQGANVDERQGRTFRVGVCWLIACPDNSVTSGDTPLMFAIDSGAYEAAAALLRAGADVSLQNDVGEDGFDRSAQRLSSEQGRRVFALLLATARGKVRASTASAALLESSRFGPADLVRTVLTLNGSEAAIEQAMCGAVQRNRSDNLEVLRGKAGQLPTSITRCVERPDLATVTYLLDHGVEPDHRHQGGNTILEALVGNMPATFYETCECTPLDSLYAAELLLRRGANPQSSAGAGRLSALELAKTLNKPDVLELLQTGRVSLRSSGAGTPLHCPDSKPPCSAASGPEASR